MADDIARWSEELARDPASGVFIPLADALRRRGELDVAMKVATRGLVRRPYDGDAHDLLARIWADKGDVERAMDEWGMALKCTPGHAGALKGMGFACHQAGQVADAERYLIQAGAADPEDSTIPAALARVRAVQQASGGSGVAAPRGDTIGRSLSVSSMDEPQGAPAGRPQAELAVEVTPAVQGRQRGADLPVESRTRDSHIDGSAPSPVGGSAPPPTGAAISVPPGGSRDTSQDMPQDMPQDTRHDMGHDMGQDMEQGSPSVAATPGRHQAGPSSPATDARVLFAELLGGGEQAALVVDGQGLVLAGCYVIADGRDVAQDVGAALSGVSDEARRAMRHLDLGPWSSLLFETEAATVAMGPLASLSDAGLAGAAQSAGAVHDGIALVAAGPTVPLGLVRRLLARVLTRAAAWLDDPMSGAAS